MSKPAENGATPAVTAADILALEDLDYAEVPVPEWGRGLGKPDFAVRIRTLTIGEMEQLVKDSLVPDGKGGQRRDATLADQGLFQLGVVRPAFTPAEVKQLWVHSSVPVGRVLEALNNLNRAGGTPDQEVASAAAAFPAEPAAAPPL